MEPGLGSLGITLILGLFVLLFPIWILLTKQLKLESLEAWSYMQRGKYHNRGGVLASIAIYNPPTELLRASCKSLFCVCKTATNNSHTYADAPSKIAQLLTK